MCNLISVYVEFKGMEYSLPYCHSQDTMLSTSPNPLFFIDTIETQWEHKDTLYVNHFYGFLCFRCASINILEYRQCIVDFYDWWTQPTLPYYCFIVPVLEFVIPSMSDSPLADDVMSTSEPSLSFEDIKAISPDLMSP